MGETTAAATIGVGVIEGLNPAGAGLGLDILGMMIVARPVAAEDEAVEVECTGGGLMSFKAFVPSVGLEGGDIGSREDEDEKPTSPRLGDAHERTRREKPRIDWLCNMLRRECRVGVRNRLVLGVNVVVRVQGARTPAPTSLPKRLAGWHQCPMLAPSTTLTRHDHKLPKNTVYDTGNHVPRRDIWRTSRSSMLCCCGCCRRVQVQRSAQHAR